MRRLANLTILASTLFALAGRSSQAEPPFWGTIFIDPDIITSADETTFEGAPYAGRGFRWMYDRRVNDWTYLNAFLFNGSFDDGLTTEIQVNPEFGNPSAASVEALKYGEVIGRLPTSLRADAQTVWIHKGVQPFGGGNNNLLIHTGQADLYEADGILEETFVHEASHTSLDAAHATAPGWLDAQIADNEFISAYARDYPDREDIAESFLTYLAVRHRADRISESIATTISDTIPNRINYFDSLGLDMYPLVSAPSRPGDIDEDGDVDRRDAALFAQYLGRESGSTWETGDFDDDDSTTLADLAMLQAHFNQPGESPSAAAVPEPSTAILLGGLIGCVVLRARIARQYRSRSPR